MNAVTALSICLLSLTACGSAIAAPPSCGAYGDLTVPASPLTRVAAALVPNAELRVLAVGSASIFGPEASLAGGTVTSQAVNGASSTTVPAPRIVHQDASENSFSEIMAHALQEAVPGSRVSITVRGGRGLTAGDQLHLIEEALKAGHYHLVIWQTGTVEAVRNLPPSEFAQNLADGAAAVEQAGADLVLIDPQFSRFLQTNTNIEPYEQGLQQVGSLPGVLLFHRFDLMRAWANDGVIDLERTPRADRAQAAERLHRCLGEQLARALLNATHP